MKTLSLFLCLCVVQAIGSPQESAQADSLKVIAEITAFQEKLNKDFKDREQSPLDPQDFNNFKGHDFFPVDLRYRVNAKLEVTDGTPFFAMQTTTLRRSMERVYGYVTFTLAEKEFRLPVYQSKDLMATEEYVDYLFFPFSDETNGKLTYGGGRYIDLRIPKQGNNLVIDFNMAYNPYCAYSGRYSCPIVPAENQMDIEVRAGVKYDPQMKLNLPDHLPGDSILTKPEVAPEYPGGNEALVKFIRNNTTYPRAAVKKKIHGVVYVQFVVGRDGSITDIRTLRGISKECDMEAERVVAMMPKWKPGQEKGENVPVRFVLPISFKGRPDWK